MRSLLIVPLFLSGLSAGERVEKANSVERIVRFELRVVNRSDRPQDVKVVLALPRSNERQEVFCVHPEPGFREVVEDAHGNRLAIYEEKDVGPGEMRLRGWIGAVRLDAAVYRPLGEPAELCPEDALRYTADGENYQVRSPAIEKVRDSIIEPGMDDGRKALAIFNHLVRNVKYFRDDRWDPAPAVLAKGQGSCSEFNYAFIALLRSSGIPCRYTGGFVLSADNATRYDARVHEDAVFHRWTEVFLKEYGWLPADASRGSGALSRFDNCLNLWGRVPAGSLQTCRGDGGGGEDSLGWEYVAQARGQGQGHVRTAPVCFWIEAPREGLAPAMEAVEEAIAAGLTPEALSPIAGDSLAREVLFFSFNRIDRSAYPALADALVRARHPSAVWFAIACERLKLPLASRWPDLADEALRSDIAKGQVLEKLDGGLFEYWWRKARPRVSFAADRKVFVLPERDIAIH